MNPLDREWMRGYGYDDEQLREYDEETRAVELVCLNDCCEHRWAVVGYPDGMGGVELDDHQHVCPKCGREGEGV